MKPQVILTIKDIYKSFDKDGSKSLVLDGICLDVNKGEFISLIGPSGCGKTTFLEILAKLQNLSSGQVTLRNLEEPGHDGQNHRCLMVFQQYNRSLFPFMTVAENIKFALRSLKNIDQKLKKERIQDVLSVTRLSSFYNYYPWQLSGGMQQRLALARALAVRPTILLLDEPFASLDAQSKYLLEDETISLAKKFNLTVIYVTHDIDSAIYCGTRVILFSALPARILLDTQNNLPDPRHQLKTRRDPRFLEAREKLYNLLKPQIK